MADHRHRKSAQPAPETQVVETILVGVFNLVKWIVLGIYGLITGRKVTMGGARREELRALGENWGTVEMHAMQPSTYALAISEADKIVDTALRLSGVSGQTMGERLKASEHLFSHDLYQRLWSAHKLRNTLAHEVGASVSADELRSAVEAFRSALYTLGVL